MSAKSARRVGLAVAAAAASLAVFALLRGPDLGAVAFRPGDTARVPLTVAPGTRPETICKLLQDKGLIANAGAFCDYLHHVDGRAQELQAGEFLLSPGMTTDELIEALRHGRAAQVRVTIPEGLRKDEVARVLARAGVAKRSALLAEMRDEERQRRLGVPAGVPGGLEGYLFPDTYLFAPDTPPSVVVDTLTARLEEIWSPEMAARARALGWSRHQVLTLASIVEKETGRAEERPHISSVFHNRMNADPPIKLQTDPTVIYGLVLDGTWRGDLRRRHLRTPHPYNTYTIDGLPPGPIAAPGKAAIDAALWPSASDDIFFVSKNDGTHAFCPDLACHQAAVQKWQVDYWNERRD